MSFSLNNGPNVQHIWTSMFHVRISYFMYVFLEPFGAYLYIFVTLVLFGLGMKKNLGLKLCWKTVLLKGPEYKSQSEQNIRMLAFNYTI